MKTKIDTVTYRVSGVSKNYTNRQLEKLEKEAKKKIPQILWISYSADSDRASDILVSSCQSITSNHLKEIFLN